MIVAGIDPSLTSAGVAILDNGQPTHLSHHGYPGHNGATWQQRSRRVRWTCGQILAPVLDARPDLVVIEGPAYGAKYGSAFDRAGLWHGLYGALNAKQVPVAVVSPTTRASWATGHGRADKAAVITAVTTWWPQQPIACDDEADSLVLALIGAHHLGDPMPFTVKPRHSTALEAIAWP
jgi:Holliday junction resolvasome RuvABC endonuclease subunit